MLPKKRQFIEKIKFWPIILIVFCLWLLLIIKVPEPVTPSGKGKKETIKEISVLQYLIKNKKRDNKVIDQKKPSSSLKSLSIQNITMSQFTPTLEMWGEVQFKSGSALELISEISAQVNDIADINVGSIVQKGQIIVYLDNKNATYKLEQAQAKLDELNITLASAKILLPLEQQILEISEKDYIRYQKLAKTNVASAVNMEGRLRIFLQAQESVQKQKSSIHSIETQIKNQTSILKEAQNNLEKTQIKAPVDGHILEINVQKGQYLNSNTSILRMVNVDEQEVQSLVSFSKVTTFLSDDQDINALIGLKGYFSLAENGYNRDWPITVRAIPAELSSQSRNIKIQFSFDDPNSAPLLRSYGPITLMPPEDKNIIIVPRDSILQGQAYILDKDNKIHTKKITTSAIGDKWLWAQNGLEVGDKLVLHPPVPFVEGIEYEAKEDSRILSLLNEFITFSNKELESKDKGENHG